MKSSLGLLLPLAVVVLLAACVAPEPKILTTRTGKPEIVINAPLADVKSALVSESMNYGYTVEQDSDYMLRMSRPLKGGEDIAASLSTGNSYSTNRRVTTFTFAKQSDGIRIVVSSKVTSQMPFGQVHEQEVADINNNVFNVYQTELNDLKNRLEQK